MSEVTKAEAEAYEEEMAHFNSFSRHLASSMFGGKANVSARTFNTGFVIVGDRVIRKDDNGKLYAENVSSED